MKSKVLVFMKYGYDDIEAFLRANFDCTIYKGDWGDPFPEDLYMDCKFLNVSEFDWIFSWLCPWKIPKYVLEKAKKGAINFHPAPPKYPGIGCYNYAIWNEDKEYGVTAHFMDEILDHGKIIRMYPVDIYENDTISTLKNRSITMLKTLFYSTIWAILNNDGFVTEYNGKWGKYKSKKDFDDFCNLYSDLDLYYRGIINNKCLERKLRATYFKGASDLPYIEVNGKKWCLIPEEDL